MSLNHIVNPISNNGLNIKTNTLDVNFVNVTETLNVQCLDQTQLNLIPDTSGSIGQVLVSDGENSLQFQSLPNFVTNPIQQDIDISTYDIIGLPNSQTLIGINDTQITQQSDIQELKTDVTELSTSIEDLTLGLGLVQEKTEHIPIAHNPFIYTDTEPINSNENRVYLDDDLNLYSGSFGDGGFPEQAVLPSYYTGTIRPVATEAELDSAILASVDYDQILVTSSFFLTSSKTINKKIQIRASSNIYTLTFASSTQLFLVTSSYVSFANLSFNNISTGSNAIILNFSLSTDINNFVTGCNFETNEFAIATNNTNIQIINNTFRFVGTGDSHRYIYITGCLGSTFINNNIFEGNGIASTQCIFISNAFAPSFLNGNLIIKNNISQVQPVQRLLMVEVNLTNANFSLYVSSNTMTTTSGFIILYSFPLEGIKQIYLYNNTEILASGITGSKGIIGLDSPANSVISFNTKIYSSRNTIPILRADYTDLINPLANQPKVIAYATARFTPAQTYNLIIPLVASLAGGTVDLSALETKTQNLSSSAIDLSTITGNLTTDSLTSETISNGLLTSSIELTTGGINITSDALNFNSNSVVYTPYPSPVEATSFIKTGGTNLQYLLADGSTLTQSANSGNSNFYLYDSSTSGSTTPTAGLITYNNAVQADATTIYISHLTRDGIDIEVFFKQVSTTTDVYIQDQSTSENYIQYNIIATPTITVDSRVTIPVILRQGSGTGLTTFGNNHNVLLAFFTNALEVDTRLSTLETKTQNIIDANVNQTSFGGSLGIIASAFTKSGGTASQFLKANGTIDSSAYITASNEIITTLQEKTQYQSATANTTTFTGAGGVVADKFVKVDGLTTQFLKANGDSDSTVYVPNPYGLLMHGTKFMTTLNMSNLNGTLTNYDLITNNVPSPASGIISKAGEGNNPSIYELKIYGTIRAVSGSFSFTIQFLNGTPITITCPLNNGSSSNDSYMLTVTYHRISVSIMRYIAIGKVYTPSTGITVVDFFQQGSNINATSAIDTTLSVTTSNTGTNNIITARIILEKLM